jgi:xanthine/uracil permease
MVGAGAGGYVDGSAIASSPAITFTWTTTFPLTIYGPAILPFMGVYVAIAMEAIGDITASSEASRVDVEGVRRLSVSPGALCTAADGPAYSPSSTVASRAASWLTASPASSAPWERYLP